MFSGKSAEVVRAAKFRKVSRAPRMTWLERFCSHLQMSIPDMKADQLLIQLVGERAERTSS